MSFISIIVAILLIALIVYSMFWFSFIKNKFENEFKLFLKRNNEFFRTHSSDENEEQIKSYEAKIQKEFLERRKFWMRVSGLLALIPFFFYSRLALSEASLIFFGLNYLPIYLFFVYVLNLYVFDAHIFSKAEFINSPKKDLYQIKKLLTSHFEPYIYICAFILYVYIVAHFGVDL